MSFTAKQYNELRLAFSIAAMSVVEKPEFGWDKNANREPAEAFARECFFIADAMIDEYERGMVDEDEEQ